MDNPAPESKPAPPPAAKKSFLGWIFSKESRLGRFNRAAVRWAALVLSLFALGLLTGYFLLYRPALLSLNQSQAGLKQTTQDLDTAVKKVGDLSATNASLSNQVLSLNQAVDRDSQHIQLLQMINTLETAHLSLANQDLITARQLLQTTQTQLTNLSPGIDKNSTGLSKTMLARLNLIFSEIDQDPKTAGTDVDVLVKQMLDYEKAAY